MQQEDLAMNELEGLEADDIGKLPSHRDTDSKQESIEEDLTDEQKINKSDNNEVSHLEEIDEFPIQTNTQDDPLLQNNLRLKNELEIVAKALDNSLRKIKIHSKRFVQIKEEDGDVKRKKRKVYHQKKVLDKLNKQIIVIKRTLNQTYHNDDLKKIENQKLILKKKLVIIKSQQYGYSTTHDHQKKELKFLKNDNEFTGNLSVAQKEYSEEKAKNMQLNQEYTSLSKFVKQNHNDIEVHRHKIRNLDRKIKIYQKKSQIEDITEMNKKLLASQEKIKEYENVLKMSEEQHYKLIRDAQKKKLQVIKEYQNERLSLKDKERKLRLLKLQSKKLVQIIKKQGVSNSKIRNSNYGQHTPSLNTYTSNQKPYISQQEHLEYVSNLKSEILIKNETLEQNQRTQHEISKISKKDTSTIMDINNTNDFTGQDFDEDFDMDNSKEVTLEPENVTQEIQQKQPVQQVKPMFSKPSFMKKRRRR